MYQLRACTRMTVTNRARLLVIDPDEGRTRALCGDIAARDSREQGKYRQPLGQRRFDAVHVRHLLDSIS